jgi:hypothetical protein
LQEGCARVLLFRGADPTIVNQVNQTPYELALVSQHNDVATLIETHKPDYVVPFRDSPLINRKRRSIYFEQQTNKCRARSSSTTVATSSLASRCQSMPKLNGVALGHPFIGRSQSPANSTQTEHYLHDQHHPSSRSSSPKSFSVTSDHGLGSECASHLSSGRRTRAPCARHRLVSSHLVSSHLVSSRRLAACARCRLLHVQAKASVRGCTGQKVRLRPIVSGPLVGRTDAEQRRHRRK